VNDYIANIFTRDQNLRAADADREAIAERLRKSHAEGRLDVQEFQERLDRCLQAKTLGDLGQLVNDLPREPSRERSWHLKRMRVVPLLATLFGAAAIVAAVWHHGASGLWALFPLFFLVRFLVWPYRPWHRRGFMRIEDEAPRL
jgi:Domain of unknown function (DUF1707)